MEARIVKLEDSSTAIRERLANIEARLEQTATKADLAALEARMEKGFADVIKWIIGVAIVLTATSVTVITFVLNNAAPKAPPPVPQPIVIYAQPAPPK
ncbi:hypothetical protein [Duganella radicis]|uniref:Uncharacterized protein n=1 Tax=Duganella radicis TaxID=551988 RepID=A0A6L6PKA9_9BURK|nr:hypothetical protein [Duganella radicis]MTV39372.1 hypothetical protein [Duganella radicis]